ncbi:uncharacterized protein LOC113344383 [Papaver somniferum]|uniref:uncharacterized protein LOC113344383 n=1 Tax=Papaver somniferum TaxID=3469 RepID=UPI000E6FF11A|nr:uncharacterized protein LOC113344383 [Papaver somniferum]
MELSDNNPSNTEALDRLVNAENNYNSREVQLNTMLKQKARIKWVKEGSANISFFHTNLKIRQSGNFISELEDINGDIISYQNKIADWFNILSKNFSIKQQKKLTLFLKSFQRACWHIIHDDVVHAIQLCWRRRFIPKGLNSNFLVLLLKIEGAKSPNHFRPIGLSNVIFKIITKIINTRMISMMTKLITPQQVAYIKGRSIQEQIILASKMVNEMNKKRRGGNVALKLDISQAYDSVNLNFLFQVICKCIHKMLEEGKIAPMVIRKEIHPTHLFFADDVFIFCNNAKKSVENLMMLLDKYQKGSGQVINKAKSETPLIEKTELADYAKQNLTMKVSDLIKDGKWSILS